MISRKKAIHAFSVGVCVAVVVWGGTAFAQGPDTLWMRAYEDQNNGYCVRQISDGGFAVAGHGVGSLPKTDADGNMLWARGYPDFPRPRSVVQTSDGGYFLAGGMNETWLYILKADAKGDSLWAKAYYESIPGVACSGLQTNNGGYVVAGWIDTPSLSDREVLLMKTDAAGGVLWTRTYGGADYDVGYSVQQTSDG